MLWLEFQWHNLLASFSPCLQINILNSLFAGGGGRWKWKTVGISAQRKNSHGIGEEYSAKDWHVRYLFSGESETHITKHCLNQSRLLENQRLREVDPNGVVFMLFHNRLKADIKPVIVVRKIRGKVVKVWILWDQTCSSGSGGFV